MPSGERCWVCMGRGRGTWAGSTDRRLPTRLGKTFTKMLCFRSRCCVSSMSSAPTDTFWQTAIIRLFWKTAATSRRRSRVRPVS